MKIIKTSGLIILIMFGVFMFIYGEADDSPGGQLLGLLAVIAGIVWIIKRREKNLQSK